MFDPASKELYIKIALIWLIVMVIGSLGFVFYTGQAQAFFKSLDIPGISWFNSKETTSDKIASTSKGTPGNPIEGDTEFENIQPLPEDDNTEAAFKENPLINSSQKEKSALKADKFPKHPGNKAEQFNILVLGIDRRSGDQTHWRTDVIQLITLSENRTKAVVTHIPRDVWTDGYKINAVYNLKGPEAIKDSVEEITGQRPDRIIRIDFDAFAWAIDHAGGLDINVPNAFIDSNYPDDRNGKEELITVEFEKGSQQMDGETALKYVRSRKGTNGEGSDYARGKRQQIVMEAMIGSYFKPDNLFKTKTAEALYTVAVEHIYTDISIQDTKVLYELLKNWQSFAISNLNLDTGNYLVVPDKNNYGGAWVLAAKNSDYSPVHTKILDLLK